MVNTQNKKIKWILMILLFSMMFLTLGYGDLNTSMRRGVFFFESLVQGNFRSQYHYESIFYIPVHFLMGVWMLPITIAKIFVSDAVVDTTFTFLWAKLFVLIVAVGCVILYRKLLVILECDDRDFWTFFLCGCPLLWAPVIALGQYDQMEIFFGLLAILYAEREERLALRTLLILSVAVSVKLMFLLGAVLLILAKEKRLLHIVKDLLVVLSISAVLFVIFKLLHAGVNHAEMSVTYFDWKMPATVSSGSVSTPAFLIYYCILAAIAYFYISPSCGSQFVKSISWLLMACYAGFLLLLSSANPFWSVLLVFFFCLVLAGEKERQEENILLGILFQSALFISQIFSFFWVYLTESSFDYSFMKSLPRLEYGGHNIHNGAEIIQYILKADFLMPAVGAASLVSCLVILVRNNIWRPSAAVETGERHLPALKSFICGLLLAIIFLYFFLEILITFIF